MTPFIRKYFFTDENLLFHIYQTSQVFKTREV